ncbi:MAG: hypothetical protein AAF231_15050, partial [Pseudomonadota bacterium]
MSKEPEEIGILAIVLEGAIAALEALPAGYKPSNNGRPSSPEQDRAAAVDGISVHDLLSDEDVCAFISAELEAIPAALFDPFVEASRLISFILAGFGVTARQDTSLVGMVDGMDAETATLMSAYAHLSEETDPDVDALGARQAMFLELQRRTLKRRAPFGETITTLLGDDALLWLT